MPAPQPSARLLRAVAAEREQLERHRSRLAAEASELRASLARIEHGLEEIDDRCALLDRLMNDREEAPADETSTGGLRGPEIRAVALQVLLENGRQALHYRAG